MDYSAMQALGANQSAANQLDLAKQYAGMQAGISVAKITTLGHVADRGSEVAKRLYDIEHTLARVMEHVAGAPASYGEAKSGAHERPPSGIVGRLADITDEQNACVSRIYGTLNAVMTHLGMNEPAAMRQG